MLTLRLSEVLISICILKQISLCKGSANLTIMTLFLVILNGGCIICNTIMVLCICKGDGVAVYPEYHWMIFS
jgi:hypothetical protein